MQKEQLPYVTMDFERLTCGILMSLFFMYFVSKFKAVPYLCYLRIKNQIIYQNNQYNWQKKTQSSETRKKKRIHQMKQSVTKHQQFNRHRKEKEERRCYRERNAFTFSVAMRLARYARKREKSEEWWKWNGECIERWWNYARCEPA